MVEQAAHIRRVGGSSPSTATHPAGFVGLVRGPYAGSAAKTRIKTMQTLTQEIASSVCREGIFMGVSRVLVGCSGGCDSTALLDILVRLAPQFEVNIAVAHLHHGWLEPKLMLTWIMLGS